VTDTPAPATESTQSTRRVRPWIAALLTLIGGWGLGLFYARRTRAALWAALANVIVGIALGAAILASMIVMHRVPAGFMHPDRLGLIDAISWGLSILVAIWVWVFVSKTQHVQRSGPLRLFGYLAIWLLPIFVALIVAMGVRFFTLQPFRMPSGSMQPTLSAGDYFVVSKSSYGYSRYSFAPFEALLPSGRWNGRQPERGDLVVFRPVPEPTATLSSASSVCRAIVSRCSTALCISTGRPFTANRLMTSRFEKRVVTESQFTLGARRCQMASAL
jgi:hypothetical protein